MEASPRIEDLPVTQLALSTNTGFAYGCNKGWRAGTAPSVLFLNPDASIDASSLARLATVLEQKQAVGIVAPKILNADGSLEYSQRRFGPVRSTYAQALFLHRLFPTAAWADELVRDIRQYEQPGAPPWVSGACLLIRRSLLEQLGGLDEGYFMYCEDKDLCRRVREAGYDIRFEPSATCLHDGGRSAPRANLLPLLAASRIRYGYLHLGRLGAAAERAGVGLGALTHALFSTKGRAMRRGYLRALRLAASNRATSQTRPGISEQPQAQA